VLGDYSVLIHLDKNRGLWEQRSGQGNRDGGRGDGHGSDPSGGGGGEGF
jgi:hypothetical protein